MEKFVNYLNAKKIVHGNKVQFYKMWVSKFIKFLNMKPLEQTSDDEIRAFISKLSKKYQQWQVDQAAEAIQIYLHYKNKKNETHVIQSENTNDHWKNASNEMINMLRLKQLSKETEKSYMYWLRNFYRFLSGQSPYLVDGVHVKRFLTYLAVDRKVAPATQNQALNALLFFFRHVLEKEHSVTFLIQLEPRKNADFLLS